MHNPLTKTMTDQLQLGLEAAKRLGATAAKLSFDHQEKTTSRFEAGRVKDTSESEVLSYQVEVLIEGRKGCVSGNRLDALDLMIERAVALARMGSAAHFDAYPPPAPLPSVRTYSDKTLALNREQMIDACRQINDSLKTYDPDLHIECRADRLESESLVVTSGGVCHPNMRTHWSVDTEVWRTKGTDILITDYSRQWCDLNKFFDPDAIAAKIINRLRWAQKTVEPPTGHVKAYFPPEIFTWLLFPIFMGLNGRNVAKGESPLVGKLNTSVLAPAMTIVDNPHYDYASGARAIDGDGIPTRKQTLFENGTLHRFLYDLDSAGLAGAEPTGNEGCSPYWPMISPGTQPSTDLLAGIQDGLYICHLIGFGQSNVINGDFACNLGLGYRIRDGEIIGRVKNTMISGNLYKLLAANVQLSSDLDHEGRCPHAVVEGINASA